MAELIPVQYRLKHAQKRQIQKWITGGAVALAVSAASLTYGFMWQRNKEAGHRALAAKYEQKSSALAQSQRVVAARQELADRMGMMQGMIEDKMLLSLLRNISDGFSETDCLESISIDARGKTVDAGKDKPRDAAAKGDHYVVRVTGITANNATLSDLVTRLSKQSSPAMNVVLQSSHRENISDGQAMRFEIMCERPNEGT